MRFPKFLRRSVVSSTDPAVISFTGGMGAQIISASIYFAKRQAGEAAYADMSYFQTPENIATVGKPGDCSHWAWQLAPFGLQPDSFVLATKEVLETSKVLSDGPRKLELGLEALANPQVQHYFSLPEAEDILPPSFADGYLCIHIRRGDYVNVASHLMPDDEFVQIAAKFSRLIPNVAVLSDSPIDPALKVAVSAMYKGATFLDKTEAYQAHRVMRGSRILVCSNSQFSLIAAMLNPAALIVIPRQWFDGHDRAIEAPLHARCTFQILSL